MESFWVDCQNVPAAWYAKPALLVVYIYEEFDKAS